MNEFKNLNEMDMICIEGGKMSKKTNHLVVCVIGTAAGFGTADILTGAITPASLISGIGGAMMGAAGSCY